MNCKGVYLLKDLYFDFCVFVFEDWIKIFEINIMINDLMFKLIWKIKKWEVLWYYKNFSYFLFIMRVVDFCFD